MYTHRNPKNDDEAPLVADDVYKIIMEVSRLHPALGLPSMGPAVILPCGHSEGAPANQLE